MNKQLFTLKDRVAGYVLKAIAAILVLFLASVFIVTDYLEPNIVTVSLIALSLKIECENNDGDLK